MADKGTLYKTQERISRQNETSDDAAQSLDGRTFQVAYVNLPLDQGKN